MKEVSKASALRWLESHITEETPKAELDIIQFLKRLVNGYNAPREPIDNNEWETYFDYVWELYPRKVSKERAKKTFHGKVLGLGGEELRKRAGQIYLLLKKQVEVWQAENEGEGRKVEYIPYFSTWLNSNVEDSEFKNKRRK